MNWILLVLLIVPFVPQSRSNDCGPASATMIVEYFNMTSLEYVSDDVFQSAYDLSQYISSHGLDAEIYTGRDIDWLRQVVTLKPAMVLVNYAPLRHITGVNYRQNHWLVAVGATPDHVIVHDPLSRSHIFIPVQLFIQAWTMATWQTVAISVRGLPDRWTKLTLTQGDLSVQTYSYIFLTGGSNVLQDRTSGQDDSPRRITTGQVKPQVR